MFGMQFSLTLRRVPVLAAAWLALALSGAAARAQAAGTPPQGGAALSKKAAAAAALTKKVDKAIADYEALRRSERKGKGKAKAKPKPKMRRRMLGWLGEIDDPRVTQYLMKELAKYKKAAWAPMIIEAIGRVPRPSLEPELLQVVSNAGSPHAVRVAATVEVMRFGNPSSYDLLDLAIEVEDEAVRKSIIAGLCKTESPQVMRKLAKQISAGEHADRLMMLRATRPIEGNTRVDNARVKCIKEGNLVVSATAWRILVDQGHKRAEALTLDVLERVYGRPDATSAAEIVRGLVLVADPDFFPAILRYGATAGRSVKLALRAVAGAAGKNPDLVEFLIEEGLEAEGPGQRGVAKVLLSKAPPVAVAPLVARVRAQLKRNRRQVLDSAAGLHELLKKDPTWVQDLVALAAASDLESRLLGLAMLLEMEAPAAISYAQSYLKHSAWELRSLSIRYLTKCRDVTSVPLFIQRFGKEKGRLAHELSTALFVHTGTRCWKATEWSTWWRKNKVGFALPHPESVKGGGSTSGGNTVSYYDIPLVSSRIAFLVDHSGSMGAKVATDRKLNRLDVAKQQLTSVISALPKTHKVNLIPFESDVTRIWRDIRKLSSGNRRELLEYVGKIKLAGGTNTYGALMLAMEDPDVDTIYLLTDGVPSSGELTNADDILDAVQRENRVRQVVIHSISIGLNSTLLKDLAAMTGGEYKFVR